MIIDGFQAARLESSQWFDRRIDDIMGSQECLEQQAWHTDSSHAPTRPRSLCDSVQRNPRDDSTDTSSMNVIKVLIVLSLAGGGYAYWKHHHPSRQDPAALSTGASDPFVSLPPVDGQRAQTVFVIAAQNCPHEDAQRADDLAEALSRQGIPVERTHQALFRFTGQPDSATMERIDTIMNGPLPVVFINGRAKSNPSLDEVASEFRQAVR